MTKAPPKWAETQAAFGQALGAPGQAMPLGVKPYESGGVPKKRFDVYRNNVALSLIRVLEDAFPVTRAIVGEDFFTTLARTYSAENLPKSPLMFEYGAELPDFIPGYKHAEKLPFLEDLARLEWARNVALYGPDAEPLSINELGGIGEAELPQLTFTLHPTIQRVTSPWPIVSIWQAHQLATKAATAGALKNLPEGGETAFILRPEQQVSIARITKGTACFIQSLQGGKPLAAAVEAALSADDQFDISANLATIFSLGAVTAINGQNNASNPPMKGELE